MTTRDLIQATWFATILLASVALDPTTIAATRRVSNSQDKTAARGRAWETHAEVEQQKEENREFLNRFRTLPPEERVNIWRQSNSDKYRKTVAYRVADGIRCLLIMEGTDTVPYFAAIVRNRREPYFYRFWAMRILADMDRYVPEENLPKGAEVTLGVDELKLHGAIDPFSQITGQRIGNRGRQTLQWAANEGDDKWLQFFARNDLGLVKQELNALSVDEQMRRWRDSVAHTKGTVGRPEDFVEDTLGRLIVEQAPDSLPALLDLLNHEKDQYVRRAVVGLIREVDVYRFRLRKTELGRSAIEGVHKAVVDGDVRVECPKCDTPAETWAELSGQFFKDDFGLNPGSLGAYYAQMLHTLYGENTVRVVQVGDVIRQEWAIPAFNAFITFLTDKDPFFPSWEYTYFGPSYSEAFHPKFQAKMARFEDAWKQFKANALAASEKP